MGKLRKELRNFEDEVKDLGRSIDDQILQPIKNTVEAVVEDPKMLLAVGLAIAFPGAGAALGAQLGLTGTLAQVVGQTIINTTLNGGDVKSAVIGAVLPTVGQAGSNVIAETLTNSGITDTLNTVITRAVTQGTTAALLGQDPAAAFLLGGVSAGVGAVTESIPGFTELPQAARNAITTAVTAKFADVNVGEAVTVSLINDALSFATEKMDEFKKTGGITNRVVDEAIPQGDVSKGGDDDRSPEDITRSVTDFLSNKPDYSLASGIDLPKTDGLKVDSDTDGLGLKMPTSPNINTMGGGQGITVKTPEGELSESGVRPTGTPSDLGDPDSFINKPPPDGKDSSTDMSGLIDAGAKLLGGAAVVGAVSSATKSSTPLAPVNLEYGDIYKDAPIKGFSMRKGTDGRFTPFIGEKAQLAKGGFVSRR